MTDFEYVFESAESMGKYKDEWIIVIDQKIVASGKNLKEIYQKVKEKYPDKEPFVTKIPTKDVMVL